ncbi:MAG TPA: alpha/beta hydrolase [Tepidisphaeraceae bacterium]|jgi:fermentation-respiration switch protein FrsA (DUF1100 family)|nr:alpha/beta hydrolase [Tepidisphaeraceae bacterium]
MYTLTIFALTVGLSALSTLAADTPSGLDNGWDRKLFDYRRPEKLIVEQTTPTDAEVNFWIRPPRISHDAPDPKASGPAEPRVMGNANVIHLLFRDATGDLVPALLCTPKDKPGPFPLVIAIHGLMSNKIQVCGQVAPALLKHGFAVLAADLPCHGERPGNPLDLIPGSDWQKVFPKYRKAVVDNRQLIDLAETLPQLDVKSGINFVGYSLGSWVSCVVGPCDDRVKAMALMVGGAHNIPESALKIPEMRAVDPRLAIVHFAGRPLLLLNGRNDNLVVASMSERLFAACPEPKKQLWYDSGHLLPAEAYADGADWIAKRAETHRDAEAGQKRAG